MYSLQFYIQHIYLVLILRECIEEEVTFVECLQCARHSPYILIYISHLFEVVFLFPSPKR